MLDMVAPEDKNREGNFSLQGPDFAAFEFPQNCHLVITTSGAVSTWGASGVREIFRSGSSGIVAARRAKDGGDVLAVADSQVVLLHNSKKKMDRSYRLKGSDVRTLHKRLLQYFSWKWGAFDVLASINGR